MNGLTLNQKAILGKDYVVDATPTEGSNNLITSGAVYTAIENAGSSPFVATYGTTTSAEIESAYQQNREIQLKYTKSSGGTTHTYISSDFVRNSDTDVRWMITDSSESSNSVTFISCISNTWSVQDSLSLDDQKWLSSTNYGGLVSSGYSTRKQFTGIRFNDLTYFAAKKLWIGVISNVPSSSPQYKLGISEDGGKSWRMLAITDSGTASFTNILSSVRYDSNTSKYVPCVYAFGNSTVYHSYDPVNGTWEQNFSSILISEEAGAAATGPAVESFASNSDYRSVVFPKNSESTSTYYAYISGTSDRWDSYDSLPAEGSYRAVTYDEYNGRFIAVGFGSNIALYSDYAGTTFTSSTLPLTSDWCSIAYGNDAVIAISSSNLYSGAISKDHGVSWTEVDLTPAIECAPLLDSSNAKWTSICYGDGKFIITGQNIGYSLVSTDGDTWYPIALPGVRTESIFDSRIFYDSSSSRAVMYGPDSNYLFFYESSTDNQLINKISESVQEPVYLEIAYDSNCLSETFNHSTDNVFRRKDSSGETLTMAVACNMLKDGSPLLVNLTTGMMNKVVTVYPTVQYHDGYNYYHLNFNIVDETNFDRSGTYDTSGHSVDIEYTSSSVVIKLVYYRSSQVRFYINPNTRSPYIMNFVSSTPTLDSLDALYQFYESSGGFVYNETENSDEYCPCFISRTGSNPTTSMYMNYLKSGTWKRQQIFYDSSSNYFYTNEYPN